MSSSVPLALTIKDSAALYKAYMPFIRNGGVFVPTNRRCDLGDDVTVTLNLFDTIEPLAVIGRVVWVTPNRAQGKRTAGVGVQFSVQEELRAHFEGLLAGTSDGNVPTHTF